MTKQEPIVAQSPLTHEWYIATKYRDYGNGLLDIQTKHSIPEDTIARIAWDFLLREQMKDCDKGFKTIVNTPHDGAFLVSVRRADSEGENEKWK